MKPMLAATIDDVAKLKFPLLASPKLDGIRCLIIDGVPHSRNLKPIQNLYIRSMLHGLGGLDGELIVGDPKADDCFNRSTSGVMSRDGEPKFQFYVFDVWDHTPGLQFEDRLKLAKTSLATGDGKPHPFCRHVTHKKVKSAEELLAYETQMLLAGFEGVMVRDPTGPYKEGRATLREGYLSKLKRFADGEAEIIGFVEQQRNDNEKTEDELGRAKRSSAKAGKVGKGTLGALEVRDIDSGVEFEIGTGFDDALRQQIWDTRFNGPMSSWLNRVIKYKHQPVGAVDKPRFPVYLGVRDLRDR